MPVLDNKLKDDLTATAVKQLEVSASFKHSRLQDIARNEDLYLGKRKPSSRGRFNVALPVMEGYIDTLLSKTDDPPLITRKPHKDEDVISAKKIDAFWHFDISQIRSRWAQKDRWGKKLAFLSGRAIYRTFAESDPKYRSIRENVDHYDFHCEPQGGAHLEDHRFLGQTGIWKSKHDLENNPLYDKEQVKKLIDRTSDENFKKNEDVIKHKADRMRALGLDTSSHEFIGETMFNLAEWGMVWQGTRYYLLLDPLTGTWIRVEEQKEVFESDLWQWTSWATEEDPFNFWNRAPADIMRPVAFAQQVIFNQILDANARRIYGQRMFDPKRVPDPSQLQFRPEGLIEVNLLPGQSLKDAVLTMETPEITSSVNLMEFIKGFYGRETGITPSAQGFGQEERVGILESNLRQVDDRMALMRKSYYQEWAEAAERFDWGLYEHLPEGTMVKAIGEKGGEWEIIRKDLEPDFDIIPVGGNRELVENQLKQKKQTEIIAAAMANPIFIQSLNPVATLKVLFGNSGFDEEQVRLLLDKNNIGSEDLLAKASEAITDILKGKKPAMVRSADQAFLQKILDYAVDHQVDEKMFEKFLAYIREHLVFAVQNDIRKRSLIQDNLEQQQFQEEGPQPAAAGKAPEQAAPVAPVNVEEAPGQSASVVV